MKRYRIFYFLVLISVVFVGCSKDEDKDYYSVLGTLVKTEDSLIVVSDEDERLLVKNASFMGSLSNNQRVIVYFSLSEENLPVGIDYIIDVYNYIKVLHKPVVVLTTANADSIGDDPVAVRDIWVAKDYLNLNFEYYGNNKTHYINLVRQPGEINNDTIELEIRHNDNGDVLNYLMNGFVSFELESLQFGTDSVILHIKADEYDSRTFDKFVPYKF